LRLADVRIKMIDLANQPLVKAGIADQVHVPYGISTS
jgi:hypothetical protein